MSGAEVGPFGPVFRLDDVDAAVRAFGIRPGDRVLEVGGAANAFPRADVVCDLTFGETRQRNGSPGVFAAGVRYVEAAVESLPFDDGAFDFVYCTQVLEHVRDPVRAAAELSRVASRGFVETPSRAGELLNGNPTHRWIVDRDGEALVFTPRPFVEHPFDHVFYGALFRDAELRARAEGPLRGVLNHQVLFAGRLVARVEPAPGGVAFDYDDPGQAGRSHYHFARCCLAGGAPPTYALVDALAAARLLPGRPETKRLYATYLARLLRFDAADAELAGLDDAAARALRAVLRRARQGAPESLRDLPIPGALDPGGAAAPLDPLPLVTAAIPFGGAAETRDAVEGALTQDYGHMEAVVAAADVDAARRALASFEGVPRLRIVPAPSEDPADLLNAALAAGLGGVYAIVLPGDRLLAPHVERLLAELHASGVDAVHSDRLRSTDGAVLGPDLAPGDLDAQGFSPSTLLAHQAALLRAGAFEPGRPDAAARWLARFAAANRVRHVRTVTVSTTRPGPSGADALRDAAAQARLDPVELTRELISLHARLALAERRAAEAEAARGRATP